MKLFGGVFDKNLWLYDLIKWTGWLPVVFDLRMKRIYVKNGKIIRHPKGFSRGKFIIIANHKSYRDPVIIMNAFFERRVTFVATKELFENRFWNFSFKHFGCVEIDKNNISLATTKGVREKIDRGHLVALFPEGKVNRSGKTDEFKAGCVLFAKMNECPIVPVYIARRKYWYQRQKVYIGEKIPVGKMNARDIDTIIDKIKSVEKKLIELSGGEND